MIEAGRYEETVLLLAEFNGYRQTEEIVRSHDLIWEALQMLSDLELAQLADRAGNYQLRGWVELARAMRSQEHSVPSQLAALERWGSVWNRHDALNRLPASLQQLAARCGRVSPRGI